MTNFKFREQDMIGFNKIYDPNITYEHIKGSVNGPFLTRPPNVK